jgi:hypothetical protein
MRKTFVLCHETWHGRWAWEEVIQDLRKLGHYAVAPTMAGHGPGVGRHGITHKDCAIPSPSAFGSMNCGIWFCCKRGLS